MKKRIMSVLLLIVLIHLGNKDSVSSADDKVKTITLSSYEKSILAEFSRVVLETAYGELGIKISLTELPVKRALVFSNEGKTDGELHRMKGIEKKYPNLRWIPISVTRIKMSVFALKEHQIKGMESLKPFKIGIRRGVVISDQLTKGYTRIELDKYNQILKMIDAERIDVGLISLFTGIMEMKKLGLNHIKVLKPPVKVIPLYHYLHKKHDSLVPKIKHKLREMEAKGDIRAIWTRVEKKLLE